MRSSKSWWIIQHPMLILPFSRRNECFCPASSLTLRLNWDHLVCGPLQLSSTLYDWQQVRDWCSTLSSTRLHTWQPCYYALSAGCQTFHVRRQPAALFCDRCASNPHFHGRKMSEKVNVDSKYTRVYLCLMTSRSLLVYDTHSTHISCQI